MTEEEKKAAEVARKARMKAFEKKQKNEEETSATETIEYFNDSQVDMKAKGAALEAAIEKSASKEDIDKLKLEIKEQGEARMKLHHLIVKQGEAITKIATGALSSNKDVKASFTEVVVKALADNKQNFKDLKDGNLKGGKFTIDIDLKTVVDANVVNGTFGQRVSGIEHIAVRRIFMESLFNSATIDDENSGGVIKYMEQQTLTRNADWIANCTTFPTSDITWIEKNVIIKKLADSIPICNDTMENYGFIEAEVRSFLVENLDLKLDEGLLLGTGVGDIIVGVDSVAPDWVAGTFALSIPTPNIYDVIATGNTQIETAGADNKFMPQWCIMNPIDAKKMKLTKDGNGNYLIPPFGDLANQPIDGVRVIPNPLVPANQMYLGDFSKGTVYTMRNLQLAVSDSHEGTFLDDIITIRASLKKQLLIKSLNAGAFLHVASISQAIIDLTKP